MTENQSAILVKNPKTKRAIAILGKFAKKELAYKQAEKDAKAATELIKEAMIEQGITKIDIELPALTGYITLAERTSYKADDIDRISPEYLKKALDTDKVKAQHTLTGALPEGVAKSTTHYITKKFKVIE